MKLKVLWIFLLLFIGVSLTACQAEKDVDSDKIRNIEYTVVPVENLPEIVAAKVEGGKGEPFKFSYTDGESIYIAIGYGEQPTGGYSIQVRDLFETKTYIVIRTNLLGPSEKDSASPEATYPFVVVKTKHLDLPVCFR